MVNNMNSAVKKSSSSVDKKLILLSDRKEGRPKKKPRKTKVLFDIENLRKPVLFHDIFTEARGYLNPYLLYDYSNSKICLCDCADIAVCRIPDIQPSVTDAKILCFVASTIEGDKKSGIRLESLTRALTRKFKTIDGIKLWLGNPPNVVAQATT